MIRRNFLRNFSMLATLPLLSGTSVPKNPTRSLQDDRGYWVDMITRIALPVLDSLSKGKLRQYMPVEAHPDMLADRRNVTHLEAFGRTLCGIAPWLELGSDSSEEGKLRGKFIQLAISSINRAVTPSSPDFMNFTEGGQPLVDAAFFAHALIRAPKQLWGNLDATTQKNVVQALRSTRVIKPYYSNWLLFSAMIETALLKFTGEYDVVRIDYALKSHEEWYKGDGVYGDGPDLHCDYYNSFVIQPMLLDILGVLNDLKKEGKDQITTVLKRARRYAEIQERLISPEGTFPPIGRSLAYRCGAFQLLAQVALQKQLPERVTPSQVRCALTAVIRTTMEPAGTFDSEGWLTIGLAGHQPEIGEHYISTGSLYLCTVAFLPLGLDAHDEFWNSPAVDWTAKKAFAGQKFSIDKAI